MSGKSGRPWRSSGAGSLPSLDQRPSPRNPSEFASAGSRPQDISFPELKNPGRKDSCQPRGVSVSFKWEGGELGSGTSCIPRYTGSTYFPSNPLGAIAHCDGRYWHVTQSTYFRSVTDVTMTAKTVALDSGAYDLLLRSKRPGETFSEVVRRKLRPPSRISDLAGSLSDLPSPVWSEIHRERDSHRRNDAKRQKRLERPKNGA